MKTLNFENVYLQDAGSSCGPMEKEGPIGEKVDVSFDDIYCGEKNYEMAERKLVSEAVHTVLDKVKMKPEDLDLVIAGDLINQLASSHYFARNIPVPFLGMYGACSNSTLIAANAAMWIESGTDKKVLTFTSSHNATAERQFRYPNEYGVQKPDTTTYTVTGSSAMVFSDTPSSIQLTQATLGRIIDWDFKDANDMGSAMAPAALDTILNHFKNTNTSFNDYDLVVTGDLSTVGNKILVDLIKQNGYDPEGRLIDCGMIIYDREHQEVFSGGSGCACSGVVTAAYLFDLLKKKALHKIMVVATGALLAPILVQQKESIPCIAHAVVYEGVKTK